MHIIARRRRMREWLRLTKIQLTYAVEDHICAGERAFMGKKAHVKHFREADACEAQLAGVDDVEERLKALDLL